MDSKGIARVTSDGLVVPCPHFKNTAEMISLRRRVQTNESNCSPAMQGKTHEKPEHKQTWKVAPEAMHGSLSRVGWGTGPPSEATAQ